MRTILFLCTGNSARSILAEALVNALPETASRFRAYSAGSHPRGQVHPLAVETLAAHGIPTPELRSKSWDEFTQVDAPRLDIVITVCDQAASEACPYWPGAPLVAHWGMPDPAAVKDSEQAQRQAFETTFEALRQRLRKLAALPAWTGDVRSVEHAIRDIGRS
jgi:arsenate reductase